MLGVPLLVGGELGGGGLPPDEELEDEPDEAELDDDELDEALEDWLDDDDEAELDDELDDGLPPEGCSTAVPAVSPLPLPKVFDASVPPDPQALSAAKSSEHSAILPAA